MTFIVFDEYDATLVDCHYTSFYIHSLKKLVTTVNNKKSHRTRQRNSLTDMHFSYMGCPSVYVAQSNMSAITHPNKINVY